MKNTCWLCGGQTWGTQVCWSCIMTGPDRGAINRLLTPTEEDLAAKGIFVGHQED